MNSTWATRALFVGFFLLSGSFSASTNTLIIVLRTEETSIIATDSQVSTVEGSPLGTSCKTHITNNIVWATAGIRQETRGPFNIWNIAEAAINGGGTLDQIVDRFTTNTISQLSDMLPRLKSYAPETYDDLTKNGTHVVSIVFIQGTNIQTKAFFIIDKTHPEKIESATKNCPGECQADGVAVFAIGHHEAVDSIFKQSSDLWQTTGVVKTLNYLMGEQHTLTPTEVAFPVSILRITKGGDLNWLQNGACH